MRHNFIAAALVAMTQAQSFNDLFRQPVKPPQPNGFDYFDNKPTNSHFNFDLNNNKNYNTFDYNKQNFEPRQPQQQPQKHNYYPQPLPPRPEPVAVKPIVVKPQHHNHHKHDPTAWDHEKPWEQCQRDIKSLKADIRRTSTTCPTSSSVTSSTLSLASYAALITTAENQMDINTGDISDIVIQNSEQTGTIGGDEQNLATAKADAKDLQEKVDELEYIISTLDFADLIMRIEYLEQIALPDIGSQIDANDTLIQNAENAFEFETNIGTLKTNAMTLKTTITGLDQRQKDNSDTETEQSTLISDLEDEWLKQAIIEDYYSINDGPIEGTGPMTRIDDGCFTVSPGDIFEFFLSGNFSTQGNVDLEAIAVQLRRDASAVVAESSYTQDANDELTRAFSLYYKGRCPGEKGVADDCDFDIFVSSDSKNGMWVVNDKNLQFGYRIYNEQAILEDTAPTCQ